MRFAGLRIVHRLIAGNDTWYSLRKGRSEMIEGYFHRPIVIGVVFPENLGRRKTWGIRRILNGKMRNA